ncbi:MAG: undecaprenyl/decaprenyl-phosphate alpha-N-acetylglucosaminyl 1-phosphate transferase [Pirellulales bacterium]|nr:undecaprenyl/decaprenyl-phosphate alpha-N-acetylglucosaminyl 1-phosphate transferase [Pirellulales bacterium]
MGSEPTVFLLACLVSLGLTALIREIAPRIGLTDDPDGHRKLHGRAIPLGGGVAIYLTTAVILGTLWLSPSKDALPKTATPEIASADFPEADSAQHTASPAGRPSDGLPSSGEKNLAGREAPAETLSSFGKSHDMSTKLREGYKELPALLLAGLIIVIVGLIDDSKGLRGKYKLMGQAAAALVLIAGGLTIDRIDFLGCVISFGPFAWLVTLIWLLGAINALNLLDGIDGLATILGIILSCTIAAMAVVMASPAVANQGVAIIAMVFVGSLLGFLRFNFPPASMFLGDSGSMLIGLVVGALAIGGSLKGPGTVLLAAPLAVWTIPFFDSVAAILRRKLTGRSVYETDRAHLHHRLMNLLGSNRKVLGWVAVCCAVLAVATLVGLVLKDDRIMVITCLGVVGIFIATGIFGRVELLLVGTRLRGIGRTLISPIFARRDTAWQTSIHLQGNQQWDLLWATFVESAEKLRLVKIRLDVNIPTMAEAYHASWERPSRAGGSCRWHVEIPLTINRHLVGHVFVVGQRNEHSACQDIQQLMELIEPFELKLQMLAMENETSNHPAGGESAEKPCDDNEPFKPNPYPK